MHAPHASYNDRLNQALTDAHASRASPEQQKDHDGYGQNNAQIPTPPVPTALAADTGEEQPSLTSISDAVPQRDLALTLPEEPLI